MVRRKQLRGDWGGAPRQGGGRWAGMALVPWWDRKRVVSRGQREARAGNESYSTRGEVMKDFTQGSDSF